MIAAGTHGARKIGGDVGYTESGKDQIALLFQLTESGERITWYGYLTEKTIEATTKTLGQLGVAPDLSNIGDPSDVDVTLVVEHEAGNDGKTYAKVRWVNVGGGLAMKNRMNDAQRLQLSKRIGGMIQKFASGAPSGQTKTSPRSQAGRPPVDDSYQDDDSIPF